ncbi:hypothetical protein B0H10DRAFT_1943181 [Mycena sp. CBHHK59/15]|nr:hypothetical protein B0H10DRAFT_1943181 [Mycena sp. CBHHK59/15]
MWRRMWRRRGGPPRATLSGHTELGTVETAATLPRWWATSADSLSCDVGVGRALRFEGSGAYPEVDTVEGVPWALCRCACALGLRGGGGHPVSNPIVSNVTPKFHGE